ncbi:MAG: DUF1311 domain-containing protein [Alphaproteobacteria bacterium]|nr:DUF1311 domain-containing protein [Alphaproteobacteria bacterium]
MRLVPILSLITLLCVPLPARAEQPGFDCGKASRDTEKAICSNERIAFFDRKMTDAFHNLISRLDAESSNRLRRQQRAWLNKRENACHGDVNCIWDITKTRMNDLIRMEGVLKDNGMTPEQWAKNAHSICAETLRITNQGLLKKFAIKHERPTEKERNDIETFQSLSAYPSNLPMLRFPLQGGRTRRFVEMMLGGSMRSAIMFDFDWATKQQPPSDFVSLDHFPGYDEENDEVLRWAAYGDLIKIQDEPVVVYQTDNGKLVSWFGRHSERPLCTFKPKNIRILKVEEKENSALCNDFVENKVEILEWQVADEQWPLVPASYTVQGHKSDFPPRFSGEVQELPKDANYIGVDLDGDGKREFYSLLNVTAGPGRGHDYHWIVQADPSRTLKSLSTTASLLSEVDWWEIDWSKNRGDDANNRVQFFKYKEKTYLFGNAAGQTGIFSIKDGKLHKWCDIQVIPQLEIEKSYIPR